MPKLKHITSIPGRYKRPPKSKLPPWQPGASALRVLDILGRYRYLTSDLVAMVYDTEAGRGAYQARQQLTKLWRYGYVERHQRPQLPGAGSSPFVYTLGVEGARLLTPAEDWDPIYRRQVYNLAGHRAGHFLEHSVSTSLVHILWDLGSPDFAETFSTEVVWRDKEGDGKGGVLNEFVARVDGKKVKVQPDLTVLIGHQQKNFTRPYFFEIQRSHRESKRMREKLLAYQYLLSSDGDAEMDRVFQPVTGHRPAPGMVVYVGNDPDHAKLLHRTAAKILPADTEIWFTDLEALTDTRPRLRQDGRPCVDRRGGELVEDVPIAPAEFFRRTLVTALDGKQGVMVL